MNVNPELRYSRLQLAKQVQMITYIDDIYDVYGTLDEVELFTEAIERFVHTNNVLQFYISSACYVSKSLWN